MVRPKIWPMFPVKTHCSVKIAPPLPPVTVVSEITPVISEEATEK